MKQSIRSLSRLWLWVLALLVAQQTQAQVSITSGNLTYTQSFNSLASTGTTNSWTDNTTLPGWLSTQATYRASTGSDNAGALYSFGSTGATERALGSIASSSATPQYGVVFTNNTGAAIASLQVSYTGEQWRNGGNTNTQKLTFSYATGTGLTITTAGTNVAELDFTSPIVGATAAALDGNATANRTAITGTITFGTPLAAGQQVLLKWSDANDVGSDHGLGIDDLSVTATLQNTTMFVQANPTALSGFSTPQGTASDAKTYALTGSGLSADVTVTAPAGYQVSQDGATFQDALTVAQSNGSVNATISVRLTGASLGSPAGTISNVSGSLSSNVSVSGTVTSNTPYTPIATVRANVGSTFTIAGRVTATNQLGSRQIYIQDDTGGIVVYSGSTGTDLSTLVQLGDLVQARGPITVFNGFTEITSAAATNFTVVSGAGTRVPTPVAITLDQLPNYQGQLVSVANASIAPVASTFTGGTNYTITANGQSATLRINANSPLAGAGQPANPVSVTGIADRFVSGATTAGTDGLQLQPRILADIPGSTPAQDLTCTAGMSNSTLGTDQTLDIATWNMEFFGADAGTIICSNGNLDYNDMGPTNEDLQQSNAVAVLTKLKADIVGVEEVSDLNRLAATVASLPGSYSYTCSDRFSYYFQDECTQTPTGNPPTVFGPTKFAQKVCVIYNKATVTPVLAETKPLLTDKYNYPSANNWSSGRLPFLFVGDVTINGVTQRVHVVTIHAKSGSATADYNRRKQDIVDLKASLDATYPNAKLIIVGDYNDKLNGSIASGQQSSYKSFVDDASNYSALTLPLENNGCSTFNSSASFIDHMIISNDLAPAAISNATYVLQPFSIPNYGNTTSDHNPVVTRFDLTKLVTPVTALTVTATANPTQLLTSGSTTITASVSGGKAPYNYSFTGPGTITANGNTATVAGLPAGEQTITVTVTDATTPTPQTSFTTVSLTVTTAGNPTVPFSITSVSLTGCEQVTASERRVTLLPNYAGLTGESIRFRVANEIDATTAAGPYSLRLYTDNPVISLRAIQGSGAEVSYSYNWLAACTSTSPANTAPVAVANADQSATVGSAFTYMVKAFTDRETPNQLSYSASISPANGLSFDAASRLISGTPTAVGVSTVQVTATDEGNLSTSTVFTITVNAAGTPTPTVPFSITSVSLTGCEQVTASERRVTLLPNYAGLTGEVIRFRVANEIDATTAAGPYSLRLYTDNPVISLRAIQGSGAEVSYSYNWLAACTSTSPANTAPVAVANADQSATVGSAFSYTVKAFTDRETPNQLSYSASISPANGLSFDAASRLITGTPTAVGVSTVQVTATDEGNLSTSTVFTITVNAAGTPTPTVPFSITSVSLTGCEQVTASERRVTLLPNYAGLTGEVIRFRVANEIDATTSAGPYSLRLYTDNPVISLRAIQGSGAEVSYSYNWLAACTNNGRIGVVAESTLDVRVIGNPINDGQAAVEVRGAAGQPLTMQLIDMRGQTVGQHAVEQAGTVETHTFAVGRQPVGTLLLRVTTPTQSQTVKLLKVN